MSSLIGYNPATISDAFNAGNYRHVALSISGTIHTLYLDGSAVAVNPTAGNIFSLYTSAIEGLYIGCAGDLSYGYTGIIDDFKIWNRALPVEDILSIYNPYVTTTVVGASVIPIPSLSKSYVAFTSTTSTNTISFNLAVNAKVFMIGGGGSGAGPHGGGGGAGAYYNGTFRFKANTIYIINVGAGGVYADQSLIGGNGGSTFIMNDGIQLIVNGGGGGGSGTISNTSTGASGGCGGGAGGPNDIAYNGGLEVNTNTNGTGFAGGNKKGPTGVAYSGGGGGGAGGAGQDAGVRTLSTGATDTQYYTGGNGGNAIVVNLKGYPEAYGGGGGGGSWDNKTDVTQSVGGSVSINGSLVRVGGNANYITYSSSTFELTGYITGTPPLENTGSGGGGGGAFSSPGASGSAGIVIIQF